MGTDKSADSIYLPQTATIVAASPMTALERYLEIKLDSENDLGHQPGQFVEISVPGIGEAPISVSSSPTQAGSFEMVVRKVGNVTTALHNLEEGAQVGVRGPFGTSFPVYDVMKGKDLVFICGGLGLVPVRSAIRYVLDNRDDYGKVTILFGCKAPTDRLFTEEMAAWAERDDVTLIETVDEAANGWTGNVGVITTLLPKVEMDAARTIVIICGPPVMYKYVILDLRGMNVPDEHVYISLERHMKCGVGKCGHCQIHDLYACQDGPVFKWADVARNKEAI